MRKQDGLKISPCNLCPRSCGALRDKGECGICGAPAEMLIARAALHHWEEPVLSGKRGSGAVFFCGCPLQCVYCQNADIAGGAAGHPVSAPDLALVFLDLQSQGALNINCVTPTPYMLGIKKALVQARDAGLEIPMVWNTSGYETREAIEALVGTVDVYLADFKYKDGRYAHVYSHARDYPETALAALEAMVCCAGAPRFDEVDGMPRMIGGVLVRHLLLPGNLEDSKQALEQLWGNFGNGICYSLMSQYTPMLARRADEGDALAQSALARFPELGRFVFEEEYEELLDFADGLGIQDYFWQEGDAAQESFIPAWDGTGVV